jgi:hypothetical protein
MGEFKRGLGSTSDAGIHRFANWWRGILMTFVRLVIIGSLVLVSCVLIGYAAARYLLSI